LLIHDTWSKSDLLVWRQRFITGQWGWEVPARLVDAGESAPDAAVREMLVPELVANGSIQHGHSFVTVIISMQRVLLETH